jgi:hypothetical protein
MPVVNAPINVEIINIPHMVTIAEINRRVPPVSSAAEPGSRKTFLRNKFSEFI